MKPALRLLATLFLLLPLSVPAKAQVSPFGSAWETDSRAEQRQDEIVKEANDKDTCDGLFTNNPECPNFCDALCVDGILEQFRRNMSNPSPPTQKLSAGEWFAAFFVALLAVIGMTVLCFIP